MADNITLNSGTGGATLAADDISSVWYQIVKLAHGALDSATLVSTASGLPVDIRASNATVTVDLGGNNDVTIDASSIVKAEDAAHSTGDAGVQMLAVRKATPADLSGADGDYEPLQMDNGRLWVTTTIDGPLGGGAEAGALLVTIANDSTGVVSVDDGAGSLTVDSGAAFTVQEDGAALTALQLIDDTVYVDDADWTDSTSKHLLVGGLYQSTPQTITDGDVGPLEVDSTGRLRVVVEATASHAVTNAGTFVVQEDGAALTALQLIDNPVAVLGTATYTETTTSGMIAGAVRNDALATLAGTDNEIAPLQVNAAGALYTRPHSSSTGGCKMFTSVDLDESEEDPASGPVTIYGIYAWNVTAAPLWLQMFNTNTVTVGTTAPTNNFMIPANADSDGAGVVLPIPVSGLAYSTALSVAITTGSGTNAGAPGAGEAGIAILYQD